MLWPLGHVGIGRTLKRGSAQARLAKVYLVRMKHPLLVVAALVLLTACGGRDERRASAPPETPPPGAVASATIAAPSAVRAEGCGKATDGGASLRTITSDGLERTFRVFVPPSYSAGQPMAVVLNYHGFAGESLGQEWYAGARDAATRFGFIAVAPDGSGEPQRWWLAGERLPGYVDDFAFTRRMLADLASVYCVDPARVYASGISNGGFFSSIAGCQLQDVIAAVATVAGEGFPDTACEGKKPVPILVFHGTADATVPFDPPPGRTRLGIMVRSTRDSVASWAQFNGCNATPQEQRTAPDIVFVSYTGCRDRGDVQLYIVEGGGHSWPGAPAVEILGHTTQSINATELMWRFFSEHPKR
jgi:polyhydroxybutyrate depolymerase